jgi:hypothetical protein
MSLACFSYRILERRKRGRRETGEVEVAGLGLEIADPEVGSLTARASPYGQSSLVVCPGSWVLTRSEVSSRESADLRFEI